MTGRKGSKLSRPWTASGAITRNSHALFLGEVFTCGRPTFLRAAVLNSTLCSIIYINALTWGGRAANFDKCTHLCRASFVARVI
jgi:hypothetical protein